MKKKSFNKNKNYLADLFYFKKAKSFIHKINKNILKKIPMRKIKSLLLFILEKFATAFYSFVLGVVIGVVATIVYQELIGKKESEKTTNLITSRIDKAESSIKEVTNLNEKVSLALEYYKNNDKEKFKRLFNDIFLELSNQISIPSAKLYYYKKDYKNAALEILEAEKSKPSWDYSLWKELAFCIRHYSDEYSLAAAIKFIDEAKSFGNSKILSYSWTVLPTEIVMDLYDSIYSRDKIYSLSDDEKRDIKYIVDNYKNDPFIEFLQFVMLDFNKVIGKNPRSLIKDVAIFASAYDKLVQIKVFIEIAKTRNIGDNYNIKKLNLSKTEIYKINEAEKMFKMLINQFPYSKLADDAAFWNAWLEWKKGELYSALKWTKIIRKYGNGDYIYSGDELEEKILLSMSDEKLINKLKIDDTINRRASIWYSLIIRNYKNNKFDSAEQILKLANVYLNGGNVEGLIFKDKFTYLKEALSLIKKAEKSNTAVVYKTIGNLFRLEYQDYRVASYLFDLALKKYPESSLADNIMFLKILTYRDWKPNEMNGLVWEFESKYSTSKYIDDVFAELAFTELFIKKNQLEGNKIVRYLLNKYPNGNACDNALNWLAYSLMGREKYKSAKNIYEEIIKRFPKSRFAKYARNNIERIDELI